MTDITNKWVRHLRTQDRLDTDGNRVNSDINTQEPKNRKRRADTTDWATGDQNVSGATVEDGNVDVDVHAHQAKHRSPEPLVTGNPQINRSRAHQEARNDFERRPHKNTSGRYLWTKDNVQSKSYSQGLPSPNDDESASKMVRQPETRPISQDQLVADVKGIYAGLVMVETKCIEVDARSKLNREQWQVLIARHTALHPEQHHISPATQHPSALRRVASKYATPATAMRHGSHFSSGLKDYRVEAKVGKHRVDALADTGAQSNFISAQFVDKVGLIPDDRTSKRIQLPGGKEVLSPGTVKVPFSFHGEVEKYTLDCWIIVGCTNDLILSGPFLRATKTLTAFKNRVKESTRHIHGSRLHFNLLGNERQRLWGSLNGSSALALPDTGSDVMLVSSEWARENKLEIDRDPEQRLELELADGSNVFTTGVVHDATWTFGDAGQYVHSDFYVLDDLSVDVVFSNDFIFALDVFSNFGHFMIDLDSTPDLSEFYNVRLISKYSQELARLEEESINDMNSPHARKAERVRRDRIRDAINTLDSAKQNEAWKEELQRRLIWDRHHDQQKRKAELADTGQTLAQVNGQYLPSPKLRWWKKMFLRE